MDALAIGAAGMISATQRFDQAAGATVSNPGDPQAVVDQISAKASFDASAKVVKTADRMLGSLLDMLA
jgi:hypothetical protein